LPQDDPQKRCPDITLAKRVLDWRPRIGLDEGLNKTIAYFDAMLSAEADSLDHVRDKTG
jgi:UDP-glucuronate decarboxylase